MFLLPKFNVLSDPDSFSTTILTGGKKADVCVVDLSAAVNLSRT